MTRLLGLQGFAGFGGTTRARGIRADFRLRGWRQETPQHPANPALRVEGDVHTSRHVCSFCHRAVATTDVLPRGWMIANLDNVVLATCADGACLTDLMVEIKRAFAADERDER
jgi:hypothetical protein